MVRHVGDLAELDELRRVMRVAHPMLAGLAVLGGYFHVFYITRGGQYFQTYFFFIVCLLVLLLKIKISLFTMNQHKLQAASDAKA